MLTDQSVQGQAVLAPEGVMILREV